MNFYNIKVGKFSRKGNFQESIQFVVSAKDDRFNVVSIMNKRYKGFAVVCDPIEEVLELNTEVIEKTKTESVSKMEEEIHEAYNELKIVNNKLEEVSYSTRDYENDFNDKDISGLKALNAEISSLEDEIQEKGQAVKRLIKSFLMAKNVFRSIEIEKLTRYCDHFSVSYTGRLKGKYADVVKNGK